jgi:predicted amidohydrolase YtcJ
MLDKDILKIPADQIRDTKVLMTVVGGRVVYERR